MPDTSGAFTLCQVPGPSCNLGINLFHTLNNSMRKVL